IQERTPIVARLTPTSPSHALSVPISKAKGRPEEKPKASMVADLRVESAAFSTRHPLGRPVAAISFPPCAKLSDARGLDQPCLLAFVLAESQNRDMDMPIRQRPTEGQLALARTIAAGRGSEGAGITTVPASVYVDPARFAAEQARLF